MELSDIDIIILTSLTAEKIKGEEEKISNLSFDYMVEYTGDISPVVVNTCLLYTSGTLIGADRNAL